MHAWFAAWYGAGLDGGRRTAGRRGGDDTTAGDGRRRAGGAGDTVPGEAADEAVRQEDKVRGAETQRGEAAADEGPIRQATCCRRRGRRRSCHCRSVRRHLAGVCTCCRRARARVEVRPRPCRCVSVDRGRPWTCRLQHAGTRSRDRHEITDSEFVE